MHFAVRLVAMFIKNIVRQCSGAAIILLAAILLSLLSGKLQAEVYRYTDDKGSLHFVDDISLVPEKYRGQLKDAKPLPEINIVSPIIAPQKSGATPPSEEPQPPVKPQQAEGMEVYVTSWCPYCKKLEAFLKEKGISYTRYDIEKDANANREFNKLGGSGVPLTKIGSHLVRGYNPDAILKLITKSR